MSAATAVRRARGTVRGGVGRTRAWVGAGGAALGRALAAVPGADRLAALRSRTTGRRPWLGALGWVMAGVAVLAWWLGAHFGWYEVTVVAIVAAAALIGGIAFTVGRSRYAVALDLAQRRVVVGERAVGRIEVTNASTRPLLPAEIELPVGAALAGFPLPRLAGGETHEDVFVIPTQRRCVIVVGPVRSVRGDPLGIARREIRWTDPVELFVHPRTVALTGTSAGFLKDLEGRPTRDLSPSDVSFHALREYVVGDDRRHVHWKTTARTGQLMVRQFEETRRSHLAVALSTCPADYADDQQFELAVSVAGSLGLHAIRQERDLTVMVQGGALRGGSPTRLLDDLTRVSLAPTRQDVVALAQALADDAPEVSVAVLLFGATVAPAQMRAAALRLPREVKTIAVQCVPGATLALRRIADLTVLTVGDLADLPAAMRKVGD